MTEERMTEQREEKKPFLPPRWVVRLAWRIHRGLYRVTGGRFGLRQPRPDRYGLMYVTTTGRRSGLQRRVMLAYIEDGANLVTLAMNGWDAAEPGWWMNLQATPNADVQLVGGPRSATAWAATGEERDRLWEHWREVDNKLDVYSQLRPTGTAVVILGPRQTT